MRITIGSMWKAQLFPQSTKVGRVVVLPWGEFPPISAKRLNRVALATEDGQPNSAHWWVADSDLFSLDTPDIDCLVRPPKVAV